MSENTQKRDLVLQPGSFAYMQDVTKGVVKTYTGPTVINPSAQERPVAYDPNTNIFRGTSSLEDAMKISPVAPEGYYIILKNPAKSNKHPDEGSAQPSAELEIGRTIIVPGPATFALWPGQAAKVVEGHHLRSNQYLLVRVYNEDEAKANWDKSVVRPATQNTETPDLKLAEKDDLTVGKLLIIKGTNISFYIPPTGIEVVSTTDDMRNNSGLDYIRSALTLERLEYAILVDENGNKRYEKGPQVVFPLPTERFIEHIDSGKTSIKFRAVELNEIQGIHIKIIANYSDGGKDYKAGDELFITGRDTAIYFPREEHSAIKYDGKTKHFATAVPAGEGRYVMNRISGEIHTRKGPEMLLPDPRTEVIVRRVLTDRECTQWYPGNSDALQYNQSIREFIKKSPTTRQGALSEGDFERGLKAAKTRGGLMSSVDSSHASVMDSSLVSGDQNFVGEEFSRSSTYSDPRVITLSARFSGVPQISPWTGYAVLIVSKLGHRRVEIGPTTVLLNYDEIVESVSLSTGKPKNTDKLFETPYLRISNNLISDIIGVETTDHVKLQIKLSYIVNFEGDDPIKWFAINNYVKFLCDHVRSILKGVVKSKKIEEFYTNAVSIIRDTILGKSTDTNRPGMVFRENGMRIADVEVLNVILEDDSIRTLLDKAQHDTVRTSLDLAASRRYLEVLRQKEDINRESEKTRADTLVVINKLQISTAASELEAVLARAHNDLAKIAEDTKISKARAEITDFEHLADLERLKLTQAQQLEFANREQEQRIQLLKAEAESIISRFSAVQGGFSEAILALSRNETLVQVAKAWDVQRTIAGETLADTLSRIFDGTPLKPLVEKLVTPTVIANGKSQPVT